MSLMRVRLDKFTAFRELDLDFTTGVNIFVGANGTGKTHLLKLLYAACRVTEKKEPLVDELVAIFLPHKGRIGRLVHRHDGDQARATAEIHRDNSRLNLEFSAQASGLQTVAGFAEWTASPVTSAFIPAKEFLAHASGFRSLYQRREVSFEVIYDDLLALAYLPGLRGPVDENREAILQRVGKVIDGRVVARGEEFFLENGRGDLEFSLLAEGMRKLGLLWLLVRNGSLFAGSVLFWDEPEANLNPRVLGEVAEVLLQLQRLGVQVFIATHDYVLLKEFDLRSHPDDAICFHALYRDKESGDLHSSTSSSFVQIDPNVILDTFADLFDRDVQQSLQG